MSNIVLALIIVILMVIVIFHVPSVYAALMDTESLGEACDYVIVRNNEFWEDILEWGNSLLGIVSWIVRGPQLALLLILCIPCAIFKAIFCALFKKRS